MKFFFVAVGGILALVLFFERATRVNKIEPEVFTTEQVAVQYTWTTPEPWWGLADPANVGAYAKWFGLKSYDAEIGIPSYQAHSRGYSIRRESIVHVAPVANARYECSNSFWFVTCVGPFRYRLDERKTLFQAGGYMIRPPSDWLEDTRQAKLTIWKYF